MKLFVEHLTTIDSAYLHPQYGLLGESWMVDITLEGALDDQSMVMDFADVKRKLKFVIDDTIDHTLIMPQLSPELALDNHKDFLVARWSFGGGETLEHTSPHKAVTLLKAKEVTHDTIIEHLKGVLAPFLPDSVKGIELHLRTEVTNEPTYQYVHGLKKHGGNCQRIAHGHRSRIQIFRNDVRAHDLEQAWAADWKTAYIGSIEDLEKELDGFSHFAYTSQQGAFRLLYPTKLCRMIGTDSTVECIATFIAGTLKSREPNASFTVRAYEGVQKGAIAQA